MAVVDLPDGNVAVAQISPAMPNVDLPDWTEAVLVTGSGGSIGGTPPPVGGYLAWWDASAIAGLADGAAVAAWADGSANHLDLAQASGPARPLYYSTTSAHLIGGLPAVTFSAAGMYMASAAGAVVLASPVTLQTVLRLGAAPNNQAWANHTNNLFAAVTTSQWSAVLAGSGPVGGSPDLVAHVVTAYLVNGAASLLRVDGVTVDTRTQSSSSLGAGTLYVGNSSAANAAWGGPIGEMVLYCGLALTVPQLAVNEAHLKAKWGTP